LITINHKKKDVNDDRKLLIAVKKPQESADGKIKYPKMAKKTTRFFCTRLYGLDFHKAVESSFFELKITMRG